MFLNQLGSSGHNFGTRNTRTSIKGSKDLYCSLGSNQILSDNFGSLSGRWRHERKKIQNIPQPWRHPPKTPNPILKIFFFQFKQENFTSFSRVWIALYHTHPMSYRLPKKRELETHAFSAIIGFLCQMVFFGHSSCSGDDRT